MLYADSKNRVSNDYPKGQVWPVSNPKSFFLQLSSLNSKWLRSLRLIFFVDGHLNRRLKTTKFTRQDSVDTTCKVCKWTNWQAERCNAKKSSVFAFWNGQCHPKSHDFYDPIQESHESSWLVNRFKWTLLHLLLNGPSAWDARLGWLSSPWTDEHPPCPPKVKTKIRYTEIQGIPFG